MQYQNPNYDPQAEINFLNDYLYSPEGRATLTEMLNSGSFIPTTPSYIIARDLLAVIHGNRALRQEYYSNLTDRDLKNPELKKIAQLIIDKTPSA